jgi:hypothetical protein
MPNTQMLPNADTRPSTVLPSTSTQLPNTQAAPSGNSVQEATQNQNTNTQNVDAPAPAPINAFFPRGLWYLYQYEENGMDLSSTLEGTMQFGNAAGGQQSWSANLMAIDVWGNTINYQYAGIIKSSPNGYLIDTQRSNDPSFVAQGPSDLVLKMDNQQSLHIEYFFNGSQIVLHLMQ